MTGGAAEPLLEIAFTAIHWRGPAPFVFVPVPADQVEPVRAAARLASYGWGVVPIEAMVRGIAFTTSLFPKDGGYLLPLKLKVRRDADIGVGERVELVLRINAPRPREP